MPDMYATMPMLTDVSWLQEFMMAATTSGFDGRHLEFRLSADVGQSRQSHIHVGHDRKLGVEVGIAAPSITVEKLFPS